MKIITEVVKTHIFIEIALCVSYSRPVCDDKAGTDTGSQVVTSPRDGQKHIIIIVLQSGGRPVYVQLAMNHETIPTFIILFIKLIMIFFYQSMQCSRISFSTQ